MGMFDFLKGVGASIFGGGKNEAQELENMLKAELGDRIKNLKVEFKDGVVKLYGQCDTHATKEKAILLAGNVKGVSQVNDDYFTAPKPEEETEFYTIKPGDSLSKIAKRYYGDAMKYPVIFEANREVIKDPDKIYPNQVIRIPKITK
ncbi:MAG: peptidoglycan-binding protein LysM [candidate division KSB1 bacterium]|nr:peptidoglycan-binding protein LysM [candidate division KSB1 bacterium]MDZ7319406.1 peptidoglycan-binding protein LysM [candidate division KSB1 bacterium]MDZ7342793.1 peptidoglycan-binding protein LysM [candidate division KSB1 bacterium]